MEADKPSIPPTPSQTKTALFAVHPGTPGTASISIAGGHFAQFQQVLLAQCEILTWTLDNITIGNAGSEIRLIITYIFDPNQDGHVWFNCMQQTTGWVRTSPGGDPINGPPDNNCGQNQVILVDEWGPTKNKS